MCVCAHTLVHMCAFSSGGHRLTSSAIPQELSSLFLETGSLSGTWGSPIVLGPQTSRIHLFPPPRTEIPSACTTPNFLCGFRKSVPSPPTCLASTLPAQPSSPVSINLLLILKIVKLENFVSVVKFY